MISVIFGDIDELFDEIFVQSFHVHILFVKNNFFSFLNSQKDTMAASE